MIMCTLFDVCYSVLRCYTGFILCWVGINMRNLEEAYERVFELVQTAHTNIYATF